ncbi:hypothetical protein NKJ26_20135 [Mesorhizobium sp. M0152]|uniref:hypothetical protein n=1 Tax=Mesorhizobium sp. M0152 TaxID=2956898 RepID=UPI003338B592
MAAVLMGSKERTMAIFETNAASPKLWIVETARQILREVGAWLDRFVAERQRIAAEEMLRHHIYHLIDAHLDDIGVERVIRRSLRLDLGRGVPPAEMLEFDYRRLDESTGD